MNSKPTPLAIFLALPASFAALAQLSAQTTDVNWTGGGTNDFWSNSANWSGSGNIPDANDEVARYLGFPDVDINVNSNFTINSYLDGFDGAGNKTTFSGTGVLTIDRNSTGFGAGVTNATGNAGGTLNFSADVTIDNTGGGTTSVLNTNSAGNTTEFATGGTLTLNTILETRSNNAGSSHQFNGTLAGGANLVLSSDNVSFGSGHDSSGYSAQVVFNPNSKLAIDGGTVLNSNANSRFQINGSNAELELNAANAINDAGMSIAATNSFTLDVNANQQNMGFLNLGAGSLTLDLSAGVTDLWFSDSDTFDWTGGSIVISGFKENTIRFGTNATGLTQNQLDQIDGGIYELTSQGYLTIPETSVSALLVGVSGMAFTVIRRPRR